MADRRHDPLQHRPAARLRRRRSLRDRGEVLPPRREVAAAGKLLDKFMGSGRASDAKALTRVIENAIQTAGKEIYKREGCWYCHTQQIRTLEPDTIRYGWRGVRAPISVPGEFVRDKPHMFGTRRIGPDLHRVGNKYPHLWHVRHFQDPRSITAGSIGP